MKEQGQAKQEGQRREEADNTGVGPVKRLSQNPNWGRNNLAFGTERCSNVQCLLGRRLASFLQIDQSPAVQLDLCEELLVVQQRQMQRGKQLSSYIP